MNSMQEVIVRDAHDWECEAVAAVMLESYQQYAFDLSTERWEEYRDSIRNSAYSHAPHARIVAELAGKSSALSSSSSPRRTLTENRKWGFTPHYPSSSRISRFPGRGIATLLIQEVARRSIQLGATTLNLHTSDMMASAVKLYERLGFERACDTDTFNGEHLVKGYRIELPGSLPPQRRVKQQSTQITGYLPRSWRRIRLFYMYISPPALVLARLVPMLYSEYSFHIGSTGIIQ